LMNQNNWSSIKIHGEGYGGKQQGMSKTYGNDLKFIVFDIFVTDTNNSSNFLDIPQAENIATQLGFEFVHYVKGPNTPEWIEEQANNESIQAIRNGMGHNKPREGIVIRPIFENCFPDETRAIVKHKNSEFWEIKSPRPLGEKIIVIEEADKIVDEWVTEQRFYHVIDRVLQNKHTKELEKRDIKQIMELMIEDVQRESEGEIIWSDLVGKKIRRMTGIMIKKYIPHMNLK
jgi:hypothetical protein